MKLSNKAYDIMKWIAQILFPAAITLYGTVANTIGLSHTPEVLTIAIAVDTFLGAILGISTSNYNKQLLKGDDINGD